MTNTKTYRETLALCNGKTEQELADMLRTYTLLAEVAKPRAAAKHWHAYFAVRDTLRAGYGR
jgi:hypothetical protein